MAGSTLTSGSQRLRVALAIPALFGIFLAGIAILDRRTIRLDLTAERRYSLSDQARKILDALPADVRILAFLRSQDPRNPAIADLLSRVSGRTNRVQVETVDVNRHPALARQYGVTSYGAIVVESEGRRRMFSNPREEVLMGALLQVTRQQRKVVGVVMGHGEGDFDETHHRRGYSTARALLEQEYYDVRPVSLLGDEVPLETSVLVVAGPRKDFLPEELAVLDRYLQRPGRALFMLDPRRAPGLAAFLRRYGVDLAADVVADPAARLYGGEYVTMRVEALDHPIVAPLDAPPLFSLTRSVGAVPGSEDDVVAAPLLQAGEQSWATMDDAVLRTGTAPFVSGRDRRGPVTVGMEFAFRALTPPGRPAQRGVLVVYGNAQFANNFFIELLGNKDLFVNSVAWLAREPEAIARRPRRMALGIQQFFVSEEQGSAAFWTTAVLLPGLVALGGLGLALRRRRG